MTLSFALDSTTKTGKGGIHGTHALRVIQLHAIFLSAPLLQREESHLGIHLLGLSHLAESLLVLRLLPFAISTLFIHTHIATQFWSEHKDLLFIEPLLHLLFQLCLLLLQFLYSSWI